MPKTSRHNAPLRPGSSKTKYDKYKHTVREQCKVVSLKPFLWSLSYIVELLCILLGQMNKMRTNKLISHLGHMPNLTYKVSMHKGAITIHSFCGVKSNA